MTTIEVIERLGLTEAEVCAVQHQGFISAELRGRRTIVYKLRFRMDRRQRVLYLGSDATFVAAVQLSLNLLHRVRDVRREMRTLQRQSEELLRRTKKQLTPDLERVGYHFHGRTIRRVRDI